MTNIKTILKEILNKILLLNSTKLTRSAFQKVFCTTYDLPVTYTAGSGWTVSSAGALLIGTELRIYILAKRSSSWGTGDITNETVATLKIDHGGKIASALDCEAYGMATGPAVTCALQNTANDGIYQTVTVQLTATHSAAAQFDAYGIMPCGLNVRGYNLNN